LGPAFRGLDFFEGEVCSILGEVNLCQKRDGFEVALMFREELDGFSFRPRGCKDYATANLDDCIFAFGLCQ
jgi:hypothetical protein